MWKREWSVVGGAAALAGAALMYRRASWLRPTPAGAMGIAAEEGIPSVHPGDYSSAQERARRISALLDDCLAQIVTEPGGHLV